MRPTGAEVTWPDIIIKNEMKAPMTKSAKSPALREAVTGRSKNNSGKGSSTKNAFPVDAGPKLAHLIRQYQTTCTPIVISSRQLVHWLKVGERATHHLHPYPAKLFPHIAHFFLSSKQLVDQNEFVIDPFAGTGTVALETILSGRPALYAEVNPLANLITAVKTRPIDLQMIDEIGKQVRQRFLASRTRNTPDVVNIEKWFDPDVMHKLARLRAAVNAVDEPVIRDFMRVTFSAVVRKASNADPRFSVPVQRCKDESSNRADVWRLFELQLEANRARIQVLSTFSNIRPAFSTGSDARHLVEIDGCTALAGSSVGMVMTSPPYAGAQKYVRASSLSLGWLDLVPANGLRRLEDRTIGREHYPKAIVNAHVSVGIPDADALIERIRKKNPTRAAIAANYLVEMQAALKEAVRVLRPGGHFVLVIGDNTICGEHFASSTYLQIMLEQFGLTTVLVLVDSIRARGLITRRAHTAGIIPHEFIILLKKTVAQR